MKTVSAKQFWSKGFSFCCFIPLVLLTILQLTSGNTAEAIWQTVMLVLLCVNNYLLCSNYTLKQDLFEQLQVNLALIEHLKEQLNKESVETK